MMVLPIPAPCNVIALLFSLGFMEIQLRRVTGIFSALILMLCIPVSHAGSATWDINPVSGDWNTSTNWTPTTVPNGVADIATFAFSNTTDVFVSSNTIVDGIIFEPGASAFTITVRPLSSAQGSDNSLILSGFGITNTSGVMQNFVSSAGTNYNYASVVFMNGASAGSSVSFTNKGAAAPFSAGGVSGATVFLDTSTASNGIFTNSGATYLAGLGGFTDFFDSSTAANGTFTNNGGTFTAFGIGSGGGATRFFENSTAGNANVTNNPATVALSGGGHTEFYQTSTAGNGTFTNNGATISGAGSGFTVFYDSSSA